MVTVILLSGVTVTALSLVILTAAAAQSISVDPGGDDISFGTSSATVEAADFYAPAHPLPAGKPGAVIRSRSIAAPAGSVGWRVLYHSRDISGNDIAVSGVVYAPDGKPPRDGRPVVAWAHATTGVGDACAPSRGPDPTATIPWFGELIDAGYVIAATDYEGLGTDGVHPYLVGGSEARAVLDSIRAARELPTGANAESVVYGHSQGGHSALFAGELARAYAPELSVRGVAAGAPVAAPESFVDHTVEQQGTLGFLVMGALGYQAAYPELAAKPVLTAASAERADVAVHGCAFDVLDEFAGQDPSIVFGVDPQAVTDWEKRLRENAAGRRRSPVPVLYWQGADDDLTPRGPADAYARRACRKGTVLDYRVYEGANHVSVLDAAHDDVMAFIDRSLAGRRPATTCAGG